MRYFLTNNTKLHKTLRTIVQGVLVVLATNLTEMVAQINIPAFWQGIIVMLGMAVLSPLMAYFGEKMPDLNAMAMEQDGQVDYTNIVESEEVLDNGITIEG